MNKVLLLQGSIALVLACLLIHHRISRKKRNLAKLPPGPKPLPLIGNIMDFPPKGVPEFQHWLKHKDLYGPISSVTAGGQTVVILHDRQAVIDLMGKTSMKLSGRPRLEFCMDWCGYGGYLTSLQYNDTLRKYRKLVHLQMGTKGRAAEFGHIQELETRRLLLRLLNEPDQFNKHIRIMTGSVVLRMTYGYNVDVVEPDPLVSLHKRMSDGFTLTFTPGAWAVDIFPAVKYLPDGFPGTGFKKAARLWKRINQAVVDVPYSFARQQMATSCRFRQSFVSKMVQQYGDGEGLAMSEEDERAIKWTAATLYGAGVDTIAGAMKPFILAMVMFPEVQRKAQEEIDRVVGGDRLPELRDRQNLPYIEAMVKESLRWPGFVPLGLPHMADEDVIYNGHLIPKDAILFPAVWWFLHDPDVYKDPGSYDPERYMHPRNEADPSATVFGFGRRVCPGRHLADAAVFIGIAQILSAFDIRKAVDDQGREVEVKIEQMPGLLGELVDFPHRIAPRSEKKAELIRKVEVEHPHEKSDASLLMDPGLDDE